MPMFAKGREQIKSPPIPVLDQRAAIYRDKIGRHELLYLPDQPFHATVDRNKRKISKKLLTICCER
jgi:hypothetical protein